MHNLFKWRRKRPKRAYIMLRNNALYWAQPKKNNEFSMGYVDCGQPVTALPEKTAITLVLAPEQYQILSIKAPTGLSKRVLQDHIDMQLLDLIDQPLETCFYLYSIHETDNECHITVCLAIQADINTQISQLNPQLPSSISNIQFAEGVLPQLIHMEEIDASFFIVLDDFMPRIVVCHANKIIGIHGLPRETLDSNVLHPLQRGAVLQICQQYQQILAQAQFTILCTEHNLAQPWQQLLLDATAITPNQCQVNALNQKAQEKADPQPHHIWCALAATGSQQQTTHGELLLAEKTTFTRQNCFRTLHWSCATTTAIAAALLALCTFKTIEIGSLQQKIKASRASRTTMLNSLDSKHTQQKVIGILSQKFLKQQHTHTKLLLWLSSQNFPGLWLTKISVDRKKMQLEGESRNIKFILAYIKWLKKAPGAREVSLKTFANKSYQAGQTISQGKKKQRRNNEIKRLQRSLLTRLDRTYSRRQQKLQQLLNEQAGEDSDQLITTKVLSFQIAILIR